MSTVYATTAVRDAVAAHLAASADFAALGAQPVARKKGQLLSQLAVAVAKLKLAVVVNPGELVELNPNTFPAVINELKLTLTVTETPLNDGLEVEQVAEALVVLLHGLPLPAVGPEVVLYADPHPWQGAEAPGLSIVNVSFRCVGLPAQPVRR